MRKYLIKSIATGLPKTFGSAFFAIALIPLIIRNVGMDAYGAWTLVCIFVGLSGALDIGIPKALVYLLPQTQQREEANALFSASAAITACLVGLVVTIGLLVLFLDLPILGGANLISRSLNNLFVLSGINIVSCSLLNSLCFSLLEARYKIYVVNICFFILTALNYTLVFLLSLFSNNVEYMIYCTNLTYIAVLCVNIALVKIYTDIGFAKVTLHAVKTVFLKGKDFFVLGLLHTITLPLNRYLVLFFSANLAACGIYDVSLKVANMSQAALICFSAPLFSLFAGYGKNNVDKITRVLHVIFILLAILYVLGVSAYLIVGKQMLEFAFGESDPQLFYAALFLILGIGLDGVSEPHIRALWALGHVKKCIGIRLCISSINIGFIFLLFFVEQPLYRITLAIMLARMMGAFLFISAFYRLYPAVQNLDARTVTGEIANVR